MEWYENNIEEAISTSKKNKSLFVVLIEDDNTSDGESWMNEGMIELIKKNSCIMVRLKAQSNTAVQFKQIYPVSTYPTVYFIGNNGKPLEVKSGQVSAHDLINSFNRSLELHNSSKTVLESSSAPQLKEDQALASSAETPPSSAQAQSSRSEDPHVHTEQGDKIDREPDNDEDVQKERVQKEIEEARKLKNLEYHALRKQTKATEELKNEEGFREKEVEKAKQEIEKKKSAMVQFKLPDGSTLVRSFEPEDKLEVARQFVLENLHGRIRKIKLSQLRPRVMIEDFEKSFIEHNLVPSAVLVVLYDDEPSLNQAANSNSFLALWTRFIIILQYLLSWIIPSSPTQASIPTSSSPGPPSPTTNPDSQGSNRAKARPKTSQSKGLRQRKEGNVHRLTAEDEDDDQATWNGNSTQQM